MGNLLSPSSLLSLYLSYLTYPTLLSETLFHISRQRQDKINAKYHARAFQNQSNSEQDLSNTNRPGAAQESNTTRCPDQA